MVQLGNSSGAVTKTYVYDVFGNEKNIDSNDTNPMRYCGEYFDKETGTIYLRARYYDAGIGRFISEDSVRGKANDPLSLNLYTYCSNNPVMYLDPTGHITQEDIDLYNNGDISDTQMNVINSFTSLYKQIDALGLPTDQANYLKGLVHDQTDNYRKNGYMFSTGDEISDLIVNSREPDAYCLTVNAGWAYGGGTIAYTLDKYGKLYVGAGGNLGKSATALSGSISANWISQINEPSADYLNNYLIGWSGNFSIGAGVGVGITKVLGYEQPMLSYGITSPQVGVSATWSFKAYDSTDEYSVNPINPYVPGIILP